MEEITAVLDARGIAELERYPNLRRLDLSGSEDYEAILAYAESHPQVELRYTVDLGGTLADNGAADLTLPAGGYSLTALREGLAYLPAAGPVFPGKLSAGGSPRRTAAAARPAGSAAD